MNEQQIDDIGKEISFAYKFYQGYGYFFSSTVAQWLGIESLPDWQHKTILDMVAVDLINNAIHHSGNEQGRQYLWYFMLHGTYSGRQTILGGDVNLNSVETMVTSIKLQKALAPQFIPEIEVTQS